MRRTVLLPLVLAACTTSSPDPSVGPTVQAPAVDPDAAGLAIVHSGEVQAELEPCG